MWDTTAYQVTIKAIGTVESSFDYGAVNPTDPISIGIAQWYATRASSLLRDMRSTNPTDWASLVGTQLDTDLDDHDDNDSWWTHRYLTSREILNLRPVLRATANKAVQDSTMVSDIDDSYIPECAHVGIDVDTNTMVAEFYMVMYHQSPRSARRVINRVGGSCTLDRLLAATLNDEILGQYRSRYNTAFDLISAQDTVGVGTGIEVDSDTTGDSGGVDKQLNSGSYIIKTGNDMHLIIRDGMRIQSSVGEPIMAYDPLGAAAEGDADHIAASDPHPQYLTPTEGNAAYEPLGTAATSDAAHVAASDPHPQYLTPTEGNAAYAPLGVGHPEVIIIAVSDETTVITTGAAKVTFRMPFAFTLSQVRASLNVASSSGLPTFNLKESGNTVFSTKVTIDATEKTSVTAATPAVISDANLADDAEMTVDIDVAGTGAKGAKLYLIGTRA